VIAIALIIVGIVFLCKGRVPYGSRRELRGPLVPIVCLIMIVPPVIFLGWGVMEGIDAAKNNRELDNDKLIKFTLMVELPSYAGIVLLCWLIVATKATKKNKRRRRYVDDYDDFDDRRDDRPRYRERDDDDYERPRNRERDDEYDDRPRRRERVDDYDERDRDDDFDRRRR
jgi:hypothetical protein